MPSFEIEFEVYCARCGAGLCNQSTGTNSNRFHNRGMPSVSVEPCDSCVQEAINKAIEIDRDERT